jgi:hypothetical protein
MALFPHSTPIRRDPLQDRGIARRFRPTMDRLEKIEIYPEASKVLARNLPTSVDLDGAAPS